VRRDGEARRVEDDEGERKVQPHRQQGDDEQSMRRHDRPFERRQSERVQRDGHRTDIRIEQEAPDHRRGHFADGVRSQHGGQQPAARGKSAREQQRHSEAGDQLDMDDDEDDDNRVAHRAPEIRIPERMYVIGEPDEAGSLAERRRRET
jgi:hypothetical protein